MGLFDSIKRPDFNEGLTKWRATPGSILLDVRGRDEYAEYGHIEGALNPCPILCDQSEFIVL